MQDASKPLHIRTYKPAFRTQVLALCIAIIAIVVLITANKTLGSLIAGGLLLLISLLVLGLHSTLSLDAQQNALITCWQSFCIKRKSIKQLPKIRYVAVIRVHTHRTLNLKSLSSFQEGTGYHVNLIFFKDRQRYKTLATLDREEALALAMEVAQTLNKPLLDHSSNKKRWLKEEHLTE